MRLAATAGLRAGVLGLTLFLAASVRAQAQAPPGAMAGRMGGFGGGAIGPGGNTNHVMLLIAPTVQEELKFTESQKNRAFTLAREASQKARELMQSMFRPGATPQAIMMAGAALRKENEEAVGQILQESQKGRFNEIALQVEGPLAVARPEVARKLGLSQNQTQQVQAVLLQFQQAQRQLALAMRQSNAAGGVPGVLTSDRLNRAEQQSTELRVAAAQQVGKILNGKQKAAFNKLLGEPFDVKSIDPDLARSAGGFPSASGSAKGNSRAEGDDEDAAAPDRKKAKSARRGRRPTRQPPAASEKP